MKNQTSPPDDPNQILTYRRIRRFIGILAFGLPIVLVGFSLIPFFKTPVQNSISYYYYSNLREILTGSLCAVSVFLICYKGFGNPCFLKNDNLMTNAAGIMALGIAFFPTNPQSCTEKIYILIPICKDFIGVLHYIFAAAFFSILAIISFLIFTIGQKEDTNTTVDLLNENHIYFVCGVIIGLSGIMILVSHFLHLFPRSTLVFEALALVAFGISWLIKGRILGSKGKIGRTLYRENH